MPTAEIVPFGKYRGQPVELLLADRRYCEWLAAQPWFREKFAPVYNIIVGAGSEPQDTPEHNVMQARYLDHGQVLDLAARFLPSADALRGGWTHRPGQRLDDEQRADLAPGKQTIDVQRLAFEQGGWDVTVAAAASLEVPTPRSHTTGLAIELKPLVGDDYPSVLRAVRKRVERGRAPYFADSYHVIVLADRVQFAGVTLAQVKRIYATRDVVFLTSVELSTGMSCSCDECLPASPTN